MPHIFQEHFFLGLLLPLVYLKTIGAYPTAPLVVNSAFLGLKKDPSSIKLEKRFLSFLVFTFSMLQYASIFEYTPTTLYYSLKVFQAYGLAAHYLNCYFQPKDSLQMKT